MYRSMYSYVFLTSALFGDEWSVSRPGRSTPWERAPRYLLDRRLGGPQIQSGRRGQHKNLLPLPGLRKLDRPSRYVYGLYYLGSLCFEQVKVNMSLYSTN
jgi:hypothetical protein